MYIMTYMQYIERLRLTKHFKKAMAPGLLFKEAGKYVLVTVHAWEGKVFNPVTLKFDVICVVILAG